MLFIFKILNALLIEAAFINISLFHNPAFLTILLMVNERPILAPILWRLWNIVIIYLLILFHLLQVGSILYMSSIVVERLLVINWSVTLELIFIATD